MTGTNSTAGVYRISSVATGHYYIGSTLSLYRRFIDHRTKLRRKLHACSGLQSCWDLDGEAGLVFEVIAEHVDLSSARSHERRLLLENVGLPLCLNVTTYTENPFLDPTVQRASVQKRIANGALAKAMAAARLARIVPIVATNISTGVSTRYESQESARRATGIKSTAAISRCLSGELRQSGGYQFERGTVTP